MKIKNITLSLLLGLSVSSAIAESQYYARVPVNVKFSSASPEAPQEPIALSLSAEALPAGTVGEPYSFNLLDRLTITGGSGSHNYSDTTWSMKAGDTLPPGLSLSGSMISGTPTEKNEAGTSFEVTGTYQDASGQQVYTIVVGGQTFSVTLIDAGDYHTCALTTVGGVKCWGSDSHGQLGDGGTNESQNTPVDVVGLTSGVASVTAGGNHTCAVTTSGAVKCWGSDEYGQLGNGGTNVNASTPVEVTDLDSGISSVTAGYSHSCAKTTTGGVKCWGRDNAGQLGDSVSFSDKSTPVDVFGLNSGIVSLTTGGSHNCVLNQFGGIKCWGADAYGQLGNDTNYTNRGTPTDVSGLSSGIAGVYAGGGHTCALTTEGGVKCWGHDTFGQVGDGIQNSNKMTPVNVWNLGSGVKSLGLGLSHSCAIMTSGGVKCWGRDNQGQLGDGGTNTDKTTPVDVSGLSAGVASVTAGAYHSCAVTTTGGLKCWGLNGNGQLGDGGTSSSVNTPVDIIP